MSNYQVEIDAFKENFLQFKEKNIILYGIGRRTSTLIPGIRDWNIIGLMDRNPENVGKVINGITIVDKDYAKKNADIIVINAPQTYWDVIYSRISDIGIPVYYTDGTIAKPKDNTYTNYPWWSESKQKVLDIIDDYDVVSFDLYDTLIYRTCLRPENVWELLDQKLIKQGYRLENFVDVRKKVISEVNKSNPNIYDFYLVIQKKYGLSTETRDFICSWERDIEKDVVSVREDVVEIARYAIDKGKEVYLVSDMHLPIEDIIWIVEKTGLHIEKNKILLSNVKKANKFEGSLWGLYKKEIGGRKALHVGDHEISDKQKALEKGVDAYKIPSIEELIKESELNTLFGHMNNVFADCIMGLIAKNTYSNVFYLNHKPGKLEFNTPHDLGYNLFGSVIYTYLTWILQECKRQSIGTINFLARDGYFLYEDFLLLQTLLNDKTIDVKYIETSRRSTMVPSIVDEASLYDVIQFPYNGTFEDFMEDRFSIVVDDRSSDINKKMVSTANDVETIKEYCCLYKKEIFDEAKKEKENYLRYLAENDFDESGAVVDLFFYGNTQYYLSKLLSASLTGFYFACDISDKNKVNECNRLIPCFQELTDEHAEKVKILKYCLLIESFLTAPNGMLLKIDDSGEKIYSKPGKNQEGFDFRIAINNGVKAFMADAYNMIGDFKLDQFFVDKYYGVIMEQGIEVSEEIKDYFYFDNALIQRRELKILE